MYHHHIGVSGVPGAVVTAAVVVEPTAHVQDYRRTSYASASSTASCSPRGFRPCKTRITNAGLALPTKLEFEGEYSAIHRRYPPSTGSISSGNNSLDSMSTASSISPVFAISAVSPSDLQMNQVHRLSSAPEGLFLPFQPPQSHLPPFVMNAISIPNGKQTALSAIPASAIHHQFSHFNHPAGGAVRALAVNSSQFPPVGIPFAPVRVPALTSSNIPGVGNNFSSAVPSILNHLVGPDLYTIRKGSRFNHTMLFSSGDVMVIGHSYDGKELLKYIGQKFRDSIAILLTALVYLELVHLKRRGGNRNTAEKTLVRRFMVCVIIASKWLDDDHPDNSQWALRFGFNLKSLNKEERRVLAALDFDVSVSKPELEKVAEFLYPWCDPMRC